VTLDLSWRNKYQREQDKVYRALREEMANAETVQAVEEILAAARINRATRRIGPRHVEELMDFSVVRVKAIRKVSR
jgi:hypothetical protein